MKEVAMMYQNLMHQGTSRQGVDLLRHRMLLELERFPLAVLQMWLLVLDMEELLEDREHQTGGVVCLLSLIVVGMK